MEKPGERASIFHYQAKVHLYSRQTPQQKQMRKNRCTCCAKFCISYENPVKQKTVKHCKIRSSNREIWQLIKKDVIMLPETKNPQKTRANLAIYCF